MKHMRQAGFTLIEMVIAISLLAIMLAVVVFNFEGNKSKAQVLVTAMDEYGNAQIRLKVDATCFAKKLGYLFDKGTQGQASTSELNFCNISDDKFWKRWSGPYIKSVNISDAGNIRMDSVAPGIELEVQKRSSNNFNYFYIVAKDVPADIANVAFEVCNNLSIDDLPDSIDATTNAKYRCPVPEATASSTTDIPGGQSITRDQLVTFYYMFEKSRQ